MRGFCFTLRLKKFLLPVEVVIEGREQLFARSRHISCQIWRHISGSSVTAMEVERSAASDGWSFSLREGDSDSDDDQPALAPKPPAPPATELDRLIAAAEAEGDEEPGALQDNEETVDIGAVDEGSLRFTETPFTISARLAANRKRTRALDDDGEAPRVHLLN